MTGQGMTGLDRLREAAENPAWCPYGSHVEIDPEVVLALVDHSQATIAYMDAPDNDPDLAEKFKAMVEAEARLLSLLGEDA